MLSLVALLCGPGGLAACVQPVERTPRTMNWTVSASAAEGAKLVLGLPETDDVRLTMTCRPLSGQVDVTILGRRGDPAVVELRSGKVVGRYSGAGIADEQADGARDIQLRLPSDDPVLTRLGDTGELTVVLPTRRIKLPNAFSQAHDFLRVCRPLP